MYINIHVHVHMQSKHAVSCRMKNSLPTQMIFGLVTQSLHNDPKECLQRRVQCGCAINKLIQFVIKMMFSITSF